MTVVYGTRPEAIKCAPIILALRDDPDFDVRVVVTGQHRHMLDQVNSLFGIVPDRDLDIHRAGHGLVDVAVRTLRGVSEDLEDARPDAVVVQGDTSSAFAAGLAAFYAGVPVVHLEAGLRTGDLREPFPEEANRALLGRLASLHLAPTWGNRENLLREGVDPGRVAVTGNSVIDALQHVVLAEPAWVDERLARVAARGRPMVVVTAHRRESWGEPMQAIGRAVARIAALHPDHEIVLPVHGNPQVRDSLCGELQGCRNVHLVEPATYGDFCRLLRRAVLVLTDSGGVQEEAPSVGTPVLVLRATTERPEALTFGTVRLVGVDEDDIVAAASQLLGNEQSRTAMARAVNPYGDGRAAERSLAAIRHWFGLGPRLPHFLPEADPGRQPR